MVWGIAEAKQRISELLRAAEEQPQEIANRGRTVAVVVSSEEFAEFAEWKARRQARTLADAFRDLRQILDEEGITFVESAREDRPNSFLEALDDPAV